MDTLSLDNAAVWVPGLNISSPITSDDMGAFSKWVMYGGFKRYYNSVTRDESHLGHDFISYLDANGNEFFGLRPETCVRAIADGEIRSIRYGSESSAYRDYTSFMVLQHNKRGLASGYCHVIPCVGPGEKVMKGDAIATLYDTSARTGLSLPTHLHLELGNSSRLNSQYPFLNEQVDPIGMIAGLKELSVPSVSPFPPHSR